MTSIRDTGSGTDTDAGFLSALVDSADDRSLATLQNRLVADAQRAGVLDVAYRTIDSPVGDLLLAATEHGLIRVAYASQGHEAVLSAIADRVSPRVLRAPGRLDPVARELDEYFTGQRRAFDLRLDMQLAHGFGLVVLDHLREIGYGSTASYGVVAAASGRPAAARAVGTACARNPLPVVVPCHRVVRGDGSLGGYVGGSDAKRILLDLEAAA